MHVSRVFLEILLVGKALEALRTGELLLTLVHPLHVVLQLTRDPEPFRTETAAQLKQTIIIEIIARSLKYEPELNVLQRRKKKLLFRK